MNSHFADFKQVKKLVVILLTFSKLKNFAVILLTLGKSKTIDIFADFKQLKK